jgi:hypothetical protein
MGDVFVAGAPLVKQFFTQALIETIKLETRIITLYKGFKKTFDTSGWGTAAVLGTIALVKSAFSILSDVVNGVAGTMMLLGKVIGLNTSKGIASGVGAGQKDIDAAISASSFRIESRYRDGLQIHSPSKLTEEMGRNLGQGFPKGLEAEQASTQSAIDAYIPRSKGAAPTSTAKSGGGGNLSVAFNVNLPNVKDGNEAATALASESFRAQFIRMVEQAAQEMGFAVQVPNGGE